MSWLQEGDARWRFDVTSSGVFHLFFRGGGVKVKVCRGGQRGVGGDRQKLDVAALLSSSLFLKHRGCFLCTRGWGYSPWHNSCRAYALDCSNTSITALVGY